MSSVADFIQMCRSALHVALLAWLLLSSTRRALADSVITMTDIVPGTLGADAFNYNQWLASRISLDEYAPLQRPQTVTLLADVIYSTPFLRAYIFEDLGGKPGTSQLVATLEPSASVPSGTTAARLIFTLPETSDAVLIPGKHYWLAVGVDGINNDAGPGQQLGLLDWSYASASVTTSNGWTVDNWIAVSNTNGAEWAASPGLPYVFDMTAISVPEPSRSLLLLTGFMIILLSRRRTSPCRPLTLALVALPLLFVSCGRQPATSPDTVLAAVGAEIITAADFQQAAARRGGGHPESVNRRALLEELITESALVQKAHAQGLDQTPEFRRRSRTLLIALLRENVPPAAPPPLATPDELTAIYHELKPALTVPAAKHLAILQLTADSPGTLQATVTRLRQAVQHFAALPPDSTRRGFGPIAAEYSEQQDTRYVGGDLGWLTDDEISRRLPAAPAAAALALTSPGQCSDVVTTGTTAFVICLSARRAAAVPPFERVAAQVNNEFARRRDEAVKAAQQNDIRQDLTIRIDEERLRSLDLRPALQASPGSGMQSSAEPPLGPSSQ